MHPAARSVWQRLLLVGITVLRATESVTAQAAARPDRHKPPETWHASGTVRVEEQANNNVFLLSDARKARLDTLTTPAPPATRFADMQSANDYITAVQAGLDIEGPGLLGRTLSVRSTGRYDFYALNAKRRNVTLGLSIAQAVSRHGRFQLRGSLVPSYFYRNFLADATDLNGDGVIESRERIYAAGTYRDGRLLIGYRQRLISSTKSHPFGAAVELEAGRSVVTFQPPFQDRSGQGPVVEATAAFDLTRSLGFDVAYTHVASNSTPATAMVLLNEPDFNRDFNGNGTTTDLQVRSMQMVDFSRTDQYLDVRARADIAAGVGARVHYQHRWRTFLSAQPFDVLNNSRRDRRDFVGAELSFRVGSRAHFSVGGDVETQKVSRSLVTSETGEVTAYTRNRLYAAWQYHL